jgi:phage terminase small subunit
MTRRKGQSLGRLVYSLTYRMRHYDFIRYRIEKEIMLKRDRRDELAKDEINLNVKWARNIIMEKDFDLKWIVGDDGVLRPNAEIEPEGLLPSAKVVQIIEPPAYLSRKAKSYPPPRTTVIFMQKWFQLIDDVVRSPMFKKSHLSQLEMLCEMHEDLENVMTFVRQHGYSYMCMNANTRQSKAYPEVAIANKLRTEIRNTYKQLGLGSGKEIALPDSGDDDWE